MALLTFRQGAAYPTTLSCARHGDLSRLGDGRRRSALWADDGRLTPWQGRLLYLGGGAYARDVPDAAGACRGAALPFPATLLRGAESVVPRLSLHHHSLGGCGGGGRLSELLRAVAIPLWKEDSPPSVSLQAGRRTATPAFHTDAVTSWRDAALTQNAMRGISRRHSWTPPRCGLCRLCVHD